MTTTVALYARTSTDRQDLNNQLTPLREYASRHGWEKVEFTDQLSGARSDRPGLMALMVEVGRRNVDVVVITKLDRLGRSTVDLLNTWDQMENHGVRVVVLDQSIDTASPAGRLLRGVLASLAEFERDLIRERIRAGIAEKRRTGSYTGGRPQIPDLTRDRVLEAHAAHPDATMRELANMIPPYRTASDRERQVSTATVCRLLQKHRLEPSRAIEGETLVS